MSSIPTLQPFHLAIPVEDLKNIRPFYREVLGCAEGRSDTHWVDFDLFGHQFVLHQVEGFKAKPPLKENPVDGHQVPVPHFGVVLGWSDWHALRDRLIAVETNFLIEPYIRFKGQAGEQATMFFLDPEGNALEFKSFKDPGQIFAK